jgi:sugar lactone lactonase YvrE
MSPSATTLVDGRAFLEGPRWHDGAVWVSDMHAQEVLRVTPDGAVQVVARVEGDPSGLGFRADGSLLVVSMRDRRLLRVEGSGPPQQVADCSGVAPFEINDLVVDGRDHAFISQFGFDFHGGAPYRTAPLLRVDPDGSVHEASAGLRMANGLVVTGDGSTLVVAESTGKDLVAFDLAEDGTLSNQRVWAELPEYPDGICIDGEDGIWIASPVADCCVRVLEGGAVTDVVDFPGRHAIACAIGGGDGHTLFVCTSSTHGEPDQSRAERGAALDAVTVAVAAP